MCTKARLYLENRLASETDPEEIAHIHKMLANWKSLEDGPLKIFTKNCDQYYMIIDRLKARGL